MLQRLATAAKHCVLDAAHPVPTEVRVACGAPRTDRFLLEELTRHTTLLVLLKEESAAVTTVHVRDDLAVEGLFPALRYVGRRTRLFPVHPEHALVLDASLDALRTILEEGGREYGACLAEELDERLDGGEWLEGFASVSIADVCWAGALRAVDDHVALTDEVAAWWDRMNEMVP